MENRHPQPNKFRQKRREATSLWNRYLIYWKMFRLMYSTSVNEKGSKWEHPLSTFSIYIYIYIYIVKHCTLFTGVQPFKILSCLFLKMMKWKTEQRQNERGTGQWHLDEVKNGTTSKWKMETGHWQVDEKRNEITSRWRGDKTMTSTWKKKWNNVKMKGRQDNDISLKRNETTSRWKRNRTMTFR